MENTQITGLNTNTKDYVAFEALNLRTFINSRLTETGIITDQNYAGSNISSIVDIIAYSYNTLMFYLNQTSSETMFTEASLYENMSRIVKLIGYNPVGIQTATVSMTCTAKNTIPAGSYVIPRYSFIRAGGGVYSFNNEVIFTKLTSGEELISSIGENYMMFEGKWQEYPDYTAVGDENESFVINAGDIKIDHFNIDVYVKDITTGKYSEWTKVDSLYLENGNSKTYEMRLNENKKYEIRFGDGVNGKKLNPNDVVSIFYLESSGSDGEIGVGDLYGKKMAKYTTGKFSTVFSDCFTDSSGIIDDYQISQLIFNNQNASAYYSDMENVDSIRKNAPASFKSQYRLVTKGDYVSFLERNYAYILRDIKCYNNTEYLENHIKYLLDIGLSSPFAENRVQFNQVQFSSSCNFGNIYFYALPKLANISTNDFALNYLTVTQKRAIINSLNDTKVITAQPIVVDPVFMACGFAVQSSSSAPSIEDQTNTKIVVKLQRGANFFPESVRVKVFNVINGYFNVKNMTLGKNVGMIEIKNLLTSIEGIESIYLLRTDTGEKSDSLSLLVWNQQYSAEDISYKYTDFKLKEFQCIYYNGLDFLEKKIEIVSSNNKIVLAAS